MQYIYDGTYEGLLTAVFESFERHHFQVQLVASSAFTGSLFDAHEHIVSQPEKATRVMKGLQKKLAPAEIKKLYWVFLSEDAKAHNALFYMVQCVFRKQPNIFDHYGDAQVLYFHQMYTKVGRERHRMQAFIRFQKSTDGLFYCMISPDFNVLPLIVRFFKNRYADQPWLIYDIQRNYGLYYDLHQVVEVTLSKEESHSLSTQNTSIEVDDKEVHFQKLWQNYFKSTNIEARRNMKLHLQHVPRRYWKYLTEKQ